MRTMLAWIGLTDIRAAENIVEAGAGPIGQAVESRNFDRILLLSNFDKKQTAAYRKWLAGKTKTPLEAKLVKLSSPTEFGEIYQAVVETITELKAQNSVESLTFHLSPGTPAMAAVWIIISKTGFPAELIESSKQAGVKTVSVPFEISAEFIPNIIRQADKQLERLAGEFSSAAEFGDIIFQSPQMREAVEQAQTVAQHTVPVLIEGESGTGKELFAKAIHLASGRKDKPFVAVNCGAIPSELVESELFGHAKGAFTGADKKRDGYFKQANGGTIFLDEIGELALRAQVRLLRVLQEKEIVPVGTSQPENTDVRVISATNRHLLAEVAHGNFREDLFYRLAVFPLFLPALRHRAGDITLLINYFLDRLNRENTGRFWKQNKQLSAGAKNALLNHLWTGNVRELQNTILRIAISSKGEMISESDVQKALFTVKPKDIEQVLNQPLGNNFSLPNTLADVAKHYLNRALEEARQNKTNAAKLVGLPNYQTFDNWLHKYQ